jgi:hypothetical protein
MGRPETYNKGDRSQETPKEDDSQQPGQILTGQGRLPMSAGIPEHRSGKKIEGQPDTTPEIEKCGEEQGRTALQECLGPGSARSKQYGGNQRVYDRIPDLRFHDPC